MLSQAQLDRLSILELEALWDEVNELLLVHELPSMQDYLDTITTTILSKKAQADGKHRLTGR